MDSLLVTFFLPLCQCAPIALVVVVVVVVVVGCLSISNCVLENPTPPLGTLATRICGRRALRVHWCGVVEL